MRQAVAPLGKPHHWFSVAEEAIRAAFDRARPGDTIAVLGMNMEALAQAQDWLARYHRESSAS
jgi:hypothetical protein